MTAHSRVAVVVGVPLAAFAAAVAAWVVVVPAAEASTSGVSGTM